MDNLPLNLIYLKISTKNKLNLNNLPKSLKHLTIFGDEPFTDNIPKSITHIEFDCMC